MPSLTIYTDPNKEGQCDVPPFVIGDSTSEWTLKFNDGISEWTPTGVSMVIGHINGLTSARESAFKLNDRAGNYGIYDITALDGIYSLVLRSGDNPPELVGSNGVYLARGTKVSRGIRNLYIISKGKGYVSAPRVVIAGDGVGAAATATLNGTLSSKVSKVRNLTKTKFGETVTASISGGNGSGVELGEPEIETFTVTGAALGIKQSAVTLISKGCRTPLIFTGDVADGYTAAEGYVRADPNSDYAAEIVITRPGTYLSRPIVTFEGSSNSSGGTSPYSVLPLGYATYRQRAVRGGAGYSQTPTASWSATGSGLTLGTPVLTDGYITSIPITSGGSGYNYVPRIRCSDSASTPLNTTDVRAVVDGGIVTAIVINGSKYYASAPTVTIEAPPTQSFSLETEQQAPGEIERITITSGGSGYSTAPGVQLVCNGSPGTGAVCKANINGGVVTSVDVIEPGSGYSSTNPPSVVFTGAATSAASATATVYNGGTVAGIAITQKGSGYSSATVTIVADDGIGSGATAGAVVEVETNELCYKNEEAAQEVITGVRVSPHSDGRISASGEEFFDNAIVVLRPRVVAQASLSLSGGYWAGTLNPVNAYVSALLALKKSMTMDLQVFGDGRMLFQGAITILNRIS